MKQRSRVTKSIRNGPKNKEQCGKNRRTNRCRFIKGDENPNPNCHISRSGRCVKKSKIDKTKCGMNRGTKRCQYLRKNKKVSRKCKVSRRLKRCVKVKV